MTKLPEKSSEKDDVDSIKFAVAILLVEVMHADHQLDEGEISMVTQLLRQQFAIDESAAQYLFSEADKKMQEVVSLHQYTSLLNVALTYEEKQTLMTNLWRIVFSDGRVDKYEEHLVRRVADLIHVRHKDFIKAKHQAQQHPA